MIRLASSVGLALALANLRQRLRKIALRGGLAVAGAIVLVAAICFFLVAGHLYLSTHLNPIASAAIIGGVLLAIALLLLFLASRPIRDPDTDKRLGEAGDKLREATARLTDALGPPGTPLRNPVVAAFGLTLVLGFLLGRRSRRRDPDDDRPEG